MRLNAQDWSIVSPLLSKALEMDEAGRAQYVRDLRASDARIADLLARLLAADARANAGALPETIPKLPAADPRFAGLEPGFRVGPFALVRELGIGGMGSVWLAHYADGPLKRSVALKLPHINVARGALRERFERERDIVATLEHPNIARLYEAGISDAGYPYLALEYVEGEDIASYCDSKRLSIKSRIQLMLQVLDAVQFAHQRLIVHRDLKPANIFVTAEGQVRLLDFGIAKFIGGENEGAATRLTHLVGNAMTLRYAAPEQIQGKPISTATDVYALGVLLYELLCGESPYPIKRRPVSIENFVLSGDVLRPVQQDIPDSAAFARGHNQAKRLKAQLTGEIETILLKAIKLNPLQRYFSAQALADDLRSYLTHKPIAAQPDSYWYRAQKFAQRHTLGLSFSSIALIGGIAMLGTTAWQMRIATIESQRADGIRGFLSELLSEAEPSSGSNAKVITAKDMLDAGVLRARRDYADKPAMQGMLLAEIGRIYARLGEEDRAFRMLNEANAILEKSAAPSDPELNKNRVHLANELHQRNDATTAFQLASRALAGCTRKGAECAKARGYAHRTIAAVHNEKGEAESALEHAQQGLLELESAFGKGTSETLSPLGAVALLARNAGQIRLADDVIGRALTLATTVQSGAAELDGLVRWQISIDLDMGRYDKVQDSVARLSAPKSAGYYRAAHYKLLSDVSFALGDWEAAEQAMDQAVRESLQANDQILMASASSARGLVYAAQGKSQLALQDAESSIRALRAAGLSETNPRVLRSLRAKGEVLLRAGNFSESEVLLSEVLLVTPASARLDRAALLDLLGCAARERSDYAQSIQRHKQAAQLLATELPADHPHIVRNRLYTTLASVLSGEVNDTSSIEHTASEYQKFFPKSSQIRVRLDNMRVHNWRSRSTTDGQVVVF
jgi:eukaryotic-like serine/threonine-protein kinase